MKNERPPLTLNDINFGTDSTEHNIDFTTMHEKVSVMICWRLVFCLSLRVITCGLHYNVDGSYEVPTEFNAMPECSIITSVKCMQQVVTLISGQSHPEAE